MLIRVLVVAAGTILLAIPSTARAHGGNSDPNAVHACVANVTKEVRIVGVTGACITTPARAAETPVHWAIQGPQGLPGPAGANGTSVRITGTLPTGDPTCPAGGVSLTDGGGATYSLCNGRDGQDGAARADGPCFDNLNRYVNCQNGTVTDTVTGLIWLRQADCFAPLGSQQYWAQSSQAIAALADGNCGLTDGSRPGDWRLPTREEWQVTIARAVAGGCTINGPSAYPTWTNDRGETVGSDSLCIGAGGVTSFTGIGARRYWSSTAWDLHPYIAFHADLLDGAVREVFKDGLNIIPWPVRSTTR